MNRRLSKRLEKYRWAVVTLLLFGILVYGLSRKGWVEPEIQDAVPVAEQSPIDEESSTSFTGDFEADDPAAIVCGGMMEGLCPKDYRCEIDETSGDGSGSCVKE